MANVYVITGAAGSGKTRLATHITNGFNGASAQFPDSESRALSKEDIETACVTVGDGLIIFEMVKYMPVFDAIPHTRVNVSRQEK